jgi:hypothetical protein
VFVGGGKDYPKSSFIVVVEHVWLTCKRVARRRGERGDRWNGHQLIAQLVVVAHGERERIVVGIDTTNNSSLGNKLQTILESRYS